MFVGVGYSAQVDFLTRLVVIEHRVVTGDRRTAPALSWVARSQLLSRNEHERRSSNENSKWCHCFSWKATATTKVTSRKVQINGLPAVIGRLREHFPGNPCHTEAGPCCHSQRRSASTWKPWIKRRKAMGSVSDLITCPDRGEWDVSLSLVFVLRA